MYINNITFVDEKAIKYRRSLKLATVLSEKEPLVRKVEERLAENV